jgi:hypothetical protein
MTTLARLLLAALCLAAIPAASADHWNFDNPTPPYFGDSACSWTTLPGDASCQVAHACNGGSPPQIVDTALYCAMRASAEAPAIVASVPYYGWVLADYWTGVAEENADVPHDAMQPTVDTVNDPLCAVVWSLFCTNPLTIPDDSPLADPVNGFPL